ncbi:hypothetical protein VTL71DRAFT_830 [Oculimacula yallundae]|uniref:Pectate lyase domain-containing protein n=1 Tax=Oculimacula yallundae TaxID=86028 RepID=A0ABR4D240_9HELO
MKSQILLSALGLISSTTAIPSPISARVAGSPVGYGAGLTTARIVYIDGLLSDCGIVDVGSNVSIFGKGTKSGVTNSGFRVRKGTNVIFQNLALGPAPPKGDILAIDESTKIWVDHNTFISHGLTGGKDDYDGLLDISHAADFITVSWNKFSGHWKGSLVGHSDNNAAQDTGKLHVTYHHNQFDKVNSRLPSVRFGTVHVFNNHITGSDTSGVNSRMGAQVYVENSVFDNTKLAMVTDLDSDLPGYLCDVGNLLTGTSTTRITQKCSLKIPYTYKADAVTSVAASVAAGAGVGKVSP